MNRRGDRIGNGGGQNGIEAVRKRHRVAVGQDGELRVASVALHPDEPRERIAQRLLTGQAPRALPTEEIEVRRDAPPDAILGYARPRGHDRADELVAGDAWEVIGIIAQVAANAVEERQTDA